MNRTGGSAGRESSMVYVSLPSVLHGGKLSRSGSMLAEQAGLVSHVDSSTQLIGMVNKKDE